MARIASVKNAERLLALLMVAVLLALSGSSPESAASPIWTKYSRSNPDYPQRVDFVVECYFMRDAAIDPIVFPGQFGMSHKHTFGGNVDVNASSTAQQLSSGSSNCKQHKDLASYWMPTIYNNGMAVYPLKSRAYYRAGTFNGASIKPMPFGLKMVAGNAMATAPQDGHITGFQCRDDSGNTIARQNVPLRCPTGDFLETSVVFPNCWNGVNLDSPDHKSHMAYADWQSHICPVGFPVQIPQLTYANRYPPNALRGTITLATMGTTANSKNTLHADMLDAWDVATMKRLTRDCINASIACADVTDSRMPPRT